MQHVPVSQIQTGLKIQFSIFIFNFNFGMTVIKNYYRGKFKGGS